ncbi:hypothetical protein HYPBUDRAFT_240650 [Hyphopichia burtonii NRRL Y-1933]|uniref:Uncharacterized protein n=1 Tax=Hyphopichia burtonii NRRL Y-1933 TaxID=984485 RepID=A0A1E4RHW3_9ASCO|nr:hypothetical protein HYPBUDRAFT_240650 [Hyphopichia burtonii NRRL Y-1933]ODV66840.1 hypothetical protein HYPBUDRAFT_240650 [Hyphopichia burtonii NRRL Y-1933]
MAILKSLKKKDSSFIKEFNIPNPNYSRGSFGQFGSLVKTKFKESFMKPSDNYCGQGLKEHAETFKLNAEELLSNVVESAKVLLPSSLSSKPLPTPIRVADLVNASVVMQAQQDASIERDSYQPYTPTSLEDEEYNLFMPMKPSPPVTLRSSSTKSENFLPFSETGYGDLKRVFQQMLPDSISEFSSIEQPEEYTLDTIADNNSSPVAKNLIDWDNFEELKPLYDQMLPESQGQSSSNAHPEKFNSENVSNNFSSVSNCQIDWENIPELKPPSKSGKNFSAPTQIELKNDECDSKSLEPFPTLECQNQNQISFKDFENNSVDDEIYANSVKKVRIRSVSTTEFDSTISSKGESFGNKPLQQIQEPISNNSIKPIIKNETTIGKDDSVIFSPKLRSKVMGSQKTKKVLFSVSSDESAKSSNYTDNYNFELPEERMVLKQGASPTEVKEFITQFNRPVSISKSKSNYNLRKFDNQDLIYNDNKKYQASNQEATSADLVTSSNIYDDENKIQDFQSAVSSSDNAAFQQPIAYDSSSIYSDEPGYTGPATTDRGSDYVPPYYDPSAAFQPPIDCDSSSIYSDEPGYSGPATTNRDPDYVPLQPHPDYDPSKPLLDDDSDPYAAYYDQFGNYDPTAALQCEYDFDPFAPEHDPSLAFQPPTEYGSNSEGHAYTAPASKKRAIYESFDEECDSQQNPNLSDEQVTLTSLSSLSSINIPLGDASTPNQTVLLESEELVPEVEPKLKKHLSKRFKQSFSKKWKRLIKKDNSETVREHKTLKRLKRFSHWIKTNSSRGSLDSSKSTLVGSASEADAAVPSVAEYEAVEPDNAADFNAESFAVPSVAEYEAVEPDNAADFNAESFAEPELAKSEAAEPDNIINIDNVLVYARTVNKFEDRPDSGWSTDSDDSYIPAVHRHKILNRLQKKRAQFRKEATKDVIVPPDDQPTWPDKYGNCTVTAEAKHHWIKYCVEVVHHKTNVLYDFIDSFPERVVEIDAEIKKSDIRHTEIYALAEYESKFDFYIFDILERLFSLKNFFLSLAEGKEHEELLRCTGNEYVDVHEPVFKICSELTQEREFVDLYTKYKSDRRFPFNFDAYTANMWAYVKTSMSDIRQLKESEAVFYKNFNDWYELRYSADKV